MRCQLATYEFKGVCKRPVRTARGVQTSSPHSKHDQSCMTKCGFGARSKSGQRKKSLLPQTPPPKMQKEHLLPPGCCEETSQRHQLSGDGRPPSPAGPPSLLVPRGLTVTPPRAELTLRGIFKAEKKPQRPQGDEAVEAERQAESVPAPSNAAPSTKV